jgi:hypothetical protein
MLDSNPDIDIVMGAHVTLLGRRIDRYPMWQYARRLFATAASLALGLDVYDGRVGNSKRQTLI